MECGGGREGGELLLPLLEGRTTSAAASSPFFHNGNGVDGIGGLPSFCLSRKSSWWTAQSLGRGRGKEGTVFSCTHSSLSGEAAGAAP